MNKKAQGQIITTILIILLVLAAIVIVWQVVNRTVTEGAEEISTKADCIGAGVTIESAVASNAPIDGDVGIRRSGGGPSDDLIVYALAEGQSKKDSSTAIGVGGFQSIKFTTLTAGDEVKAGIILADGTLCDPIATYTVTAAPSVTA